VSSLSIRFFFFLSLESASVYQFAYQRCGAGGTFTETKSTSYSSLRLTTAQQQNEKGNGYAYFYNLGDSTKYSFVTFQSWNSVTPWTYFGSFVLPVAETHNALRIFPSVNNFLTGTASLYGIRYS